MLSLIKDELRPKIENKNIKLTENNIRVYYFPMQTSLGNALNISRKVQPKNKKYENYGFLFSEGLS